VFGFVNFLEVVGIHDCFLMFLRWPLRDEFQSLVQWREVKTVGDDFKSQSDLLARLFCQIKQFQLVF
jgi:hypothetical protein